MSVNIILIHANYCVHCHNFFPIYIKTESLITNPNTTKDIELKKTLTNINKYNINIEKYDFGINEEKNNFEKKYTNLTDKINGYPTVILTYDDDNNNKHENMLIDTTVIDHKRVGKLSNDELTLDASIEFINNINNGIKSLLSDKKDLYIQSQAGGNSKNNEKKNVYYYKYIKYKQKYLDLQKKIK